jgi:uncharacterized damage-inducible protein DinB
MSVFTNRASSAPEHAATYVSAVLNLLGDTDPFSVLRETATALDHTLQALSADQARQPEAEGKWSVRDVLQHLADAELVWGYRVRRVLAEDRPALVGYDQDLWVRRLHYERADPARALEQFRVLRQSNLALVEGASDADLQRTGVHAERGEQTLQAMIRLSAGHDLVHLRQVERIRYAIA